LSEKAPKNPLYLPFAKGEDYYFPLSKRGIEGDFPDTSLPR